MFAVPGWSVAASALKLQTEQPFQSELLRDSPSSSFKSKKRKQRRGVEGNVTTANVGEMWRRHIEGQAPISGKADAAEPRKDRRKRRKAENKMIAGEKTGEHTDKENAAEKRKKKSEPGEISQAMTAISWEQNRKWNTNIAPTDDGKSAKKFNKKKSKDPDMRKDDSHMNASAVSAVPPSIPAKTQANLTPLQQSMRQKLLSARFRHLNQTLYTSPSSQSLELFTANPELFAEYHSGFSLQVKESWPSNPVDAYISNVKTRGAILPQKGSQRKPEKDRRSATAITALPRRPHGLCTIADLGCGDAQLARAIAPFLKTLNLKVLSFDLHASNSFVTKADISTLPVGDGTVDVAIFCLSLMGTNWVSFIEEVWRVLRGDGKGECWVSEVKSRFGKIARKDKRTETTTGPGAKVKSKQKKRKSAKTEADEGDIGEDIFAEDEPMHVAAEGDGPDISAFVEVFRARGFMLKPESVDKSNKMFVKMEFVKYGVPTRGKWSSANGEFQPGKFAKKKFIENSDVSEMTLEEEAKVLKPCVYKTR